MSRTFHLTDPNPMRVEDAFALFSDLNNRQRLRLLRAFVRKCDYIGTWKHL